MMDLWVSQINTVKGRSLRLVLEALIWWSMYLNDSNLDDKSGLAFDGKILQEPIPMQKLNISLQSTEDVWSLMQFMVYSEMDIFSVYIPLRT